MTNPLSNGDRCIGRVTRTFFRVPLNAWNRFRIAAMFMIFAPSNRTLLVPADKCRTRFATRPLADGVRRGGFSSIIASRNFEADASKAGAWMELSEAWDRLAAVRTLVFEAHSKAAATTGWSGGGAGEVRVESSAEGILVFRENGEWKQEGGRSFRFRNVYRWTVGETAGSLRLDHLRFGPEKPVHLFELAPAGEGVWTSSEPHVCQDDCYRARLEFAPDVVRLDWTVVGPAKDETIRYTYR